MLSVHSAHGTQCRPFSYLCRAFRHRNGSVGCIINQVHTAEISFTAEIRWKRKWQQKNRPGMLHAKARPENIKIKRERKLSGQRWCCHPHTNMCSERFPKETCLHNDESRLFPLLLLFRTNLQDRTRLERWTLRISLRELCCAIYALLGPYSMM